MLADIVRSIGIEHLVPIAPSRRRRCRPGGAARCRAPAQPDARREAISHHYDVSNTFYEWVLGPSMTYTCACYPHADATLEEAQANKYRLVFDKLRLHAGDRLLDVGCGWGSMVRYAARRGVRTTGITLSAAQAAWAQQAIARKG
jgi:cyclopropane-fatty-acyl-phospholipid synthase